MHTNLVYVDTTGTGLTGDEVAAAAREHGVMVSVMGRHRIRACTHLDVDAAGVELAVEVLRAVTGR